MMTGNGSIDLGDLNAADTADLEVCHPVTGEPVGWRITFTGPGHPRTVALRAQVRQKMLREEAEKERAQVNRRKWKADHKTPEEEYADNIAIIADRIISWTPASVTISGETYSCTREDVIRLLSDPRREWLIGQIGDFMGADDSFFGRSARTCSPSPSINSSSSNDRTTAGPTGST